jgi:hypothetical protein
MEGITMKVIIPLVFDYNATDWSHEHGIPETDAATAFAEALRRAVDEDAISAILNDNWPVMRGHVTAHMIEGLDAANREELWHLLRDARDADNTAALLDEITEHLAQHRQDFDGRTPRWIVFDTWEWDNGYFLTGSNAIAYFDDGDHAPVDFDASSVDDVLTDLYGPCGSHAALGVDLRERVLEFDDYGDNVPALLGIPECGPHRDDGPERNAPH